MAGEGRLICIGAVALGSLSLLVDLVRDGKRFMVLVYRIGELTRMAIELHVDCFWYYYYCNAIAAFSSLSLFVTLYRL